MTDAYLNRIATAVSGFNMVLSGRGPSPIRAGFPSCVTDILNGGGAEDFLRWAVPGGSNVLDAAEEGAGLPKEVLAQSRDILRRFRQYVVHHRHVPAQGKAAVGTPLVAAAQWRPAAVLRSRACCSKQRAGDS